MPKLAVVFAMAGALALAVPDAQAAPQSGTKPESSGTTQGEAVKPEAGGTKPEEAAPAPSTGASTDTPLPESKPVALAELIKDGFEIRGTDFIPAEAVTRQSGKVSSDAIVVTLQKSTATAVCFYTLKAYVSKKLTTIPACTVHR